MPIRETVVTTTAGPISLEQQPHTKTDFVLLRAALWSVCLYVGFGLLGFAVFAVDSAGAMGREADGIVGDWTRSLAHTRSAVGMPAGDARAEVLGRTARAYVRVMVSQTLAWARMDAGG